MFSESQVISPKAKDQAGILSPSSARVEQLGADSLGQAGARWAGSAVPCCSTAGVEWRPSHPPQVGSACPRTLLFPPRTQLGRKSPKPRSRTESSLCVPSKPAIPVRGQCCPFQLQYTRPAGPKLTRTSPGADPTVLLQSHSLPKGGRARDGSFLTWTWLALPPHFHPRKKKVPRPQRESRALPCALHP